MRGRQLEFYALPNDYAALGADLRSLGAVVLDDRAPDGTPVIRDLEYLDASLWVFVTRPEFLERLRPRWSEPQGTWLYEIPNDPLVELHVWRPRDEILRPGRVYYIPKALAGDEGDLHFVDKPKEFVAFAERVRGWIRRWCQKRESLLLAPSLAACFDHGQVARSGIQGDLQLLP